MQGVSTHVSNLNSSITRTTTLDNNPYTLGLAPYSPIILTSRSQLFRAFLRSPTTSGQSLYTAVKTYPRYLKEVTVSSGIM